MPDGVNSQGNSYNTPGGTNSNQGTSYHYSNTNGSYYYANEDHGVVLRRPCATASAEAEP